MNQRSEKIISEDFQDDIHRAFYKAETPEHLIPVAFEILEFFHEKLLQGFSIRTFIPRLCLALGRNSYEVKEALEALDFACVIEVLEEPPWRHHILFRYIDSILWPPVKDRSRIWSFGLPYTEEERERDEIFQDPQTESRVLELLAPSLFDFDDWNF